LAGRDILPHVVLPHLLIIGDDLSIPKFYWHSPLTAHPFSAYFYGLSHRIRQCAESLGYLPVIWLTTKQYIFQRNLQYLMIFGFL
jgi:hypothetical protein